LLRVGEWQYLPDQDKLVQFAADGSITLTADLDNLSQKVANYFIVNAGRLITKDELLHDVWGIRDVSDGRVTRVIRVLRVALGDDTREPRYIETIPKRGYRFIAPVTEVAETIERPVIASDNSTTSDSKFSKSALVPAFAVLLAALVSISWYFWPATGANPASAVIPTLRYTPVTSLDGLEFYNYVSEDERYLLYSHASPDNENVIVLMLEDLQEHKRIQLTEKSYNSFGAAFSPNGQQIAYHRYYPEGRCSIRVADFDSRSFTVSNDIELTPCGESSPSLRVSWSPDGKYLLYPTMSANRQMVLMMKPLLRGAAEQLTTPPPSSFGDYAARFSFNGDKVAFLRGTGNSAQLWLLNLTNREIKMLVNITETMPGNIGWTADDRAIIYSSADKVISRVDVESGVISVVGYTDDIAGELQTLKNGQLYATVGNFAHINIKEVSNALTSKDNYSNVVFSSNRNESYAEANPVAGGPVAVVSRRSGLPQVWLFYPDGNQKQLTFLEKHERISNIMFAPNGKDLVAQLHNEIWLISASGELTRVPHDDTKIIAAPAWSENGEFVYFAESINGRWQIARYHVATKNLDTEPYAFDQELYIESYDGKYSFWRDALSKKFYLKWHDSGVIEDVPISLPENQLWRKFQVKPSGIYYAELLDDVAYQLKFYDFASKKVLNVLSDEVLYLYRFTVSADERRVFMLQSVRGDLDIAKLALP
jgi:transcriptional activator of cad operon